MLLYHNTKYIVLLDHHICKVKEKRKSVDINTQKTIKNKTLLQDIMIIHA